MWAQGAIHDYDQGGAGYHDWCATCPICFSCGVGHSQRLAAESRWTWLLPVNMVFTVLVFGSAKPVTQRPHLNETDSTGTNQRCSSCPPPCCGFYVKLRAFIDTMYPIKFIPIARCNHVSTLTSIALDFPTLIEPSYSSCFLLSAWTRASVLRTQWGRNVWRKGIGPSVCMVRIVTGAKETWLEPYFRAYLHVSQILTNNTRPP